MASKHVIELDSVAFEEKVKQAKGKVLVDFWAPWCGPCRMLAPLLDELAEAHAGKVLVAKVNVDEQGELAAQFGISSIPTLLVFEDGRMVHQMVGMRSRHELEKALGLA